MNVSVDAQDSTFQPSAVASQVGESVTNGIRGELIKKMTEQTIERLSDHRVKTAAVAGAVSGGK